MFRRCPSRSQATRMSGFWQVRMIVSVSSIQSSARASNGLRGIAVREQHSSCCLANWQLVTATSGVTCAGSISEIVAAWWMPMLMAVPRWCWRWRPVPGPTPGPNRALWCCGSRRLAPVALRPVRCPGADWRRLPDRSLGGFPERRRPPRCRFVSGSQSWPSSWPWRCRLRPA